ncbi:helix-turn-helix domain-containing protein [bacterium]|nr:helix-turn-helix domain-containing protein [bacterium]
MENHGIIINRLRIMSGLSVQQAADKIGRSKGWLSEIENNSGRSKITDTVFDSVVSILNGNSHRPMFKTWVASAKTKSSNTAFLDGAVLRFIRHKKQLCLTDAAKITGLSKSQISKIEKGIKQISMTTRNKIMVAYGYSPSSFKNLSTDPVRSKVVPKIYKLEILLKHMNEENINDLFTYALEKFNNQKQ